MALAVPTVPTVVITRFCSSRGAVSSKLSEVDDDVDFALVNAAWLTAFQHLNTNNMVAAADSLSRALIHT